MNIIIGCSIIAIVIRLCVNDIVSALYSIARAVREPKQNSHE